MGYCNQFETRQFGLFGRDRSISTPVHQSQNRKMLSTSSCAENTKILPPGYTFKISNIYKCSHNAPHMHAHDTTRGMDLKSTPPTGAPKATDTCLTIFSL